MTEFNNNFDRELGWDDEITTDSDSFIVLEPGDYQFTVTGYERARHQPNPQNPGKLPACNKAIVSIKVDTPNGSAVMKHNLFLHSSTEGMLSAFFGAIGQKKHGEPLKMNWNAITGTTGVCRVGNREYNGNTYNEVKSMIYADSVDWTKVLNADNQPATAQPNQPQQPQQGSFFQGQTTNPAQPQGGFGGF